VNFLKNFINIGIYMKLGVEEISKIKDQKSKSQIKKSKRE